MKTGNIIALLLLAATLIIGVGYYETDFFLSPCNNCGSSTISNNNGIPEVTIQSPLLYNSTFLFILKNPTSVEVTITSVTLRGLWNDTSSNSVSCVLPPYGLQSWQVQPGWTRAYPCFTMKVAAISGDNYEYTVKLENNQFIAGAIVARTPDLPDYDFGGPPQFVLVYNESRDSGAQGSYCWPNFMIGGCVDIFPDTTGLQPFQVRQNSTIIIEVNYPQYDFGPVTGPWDIYVSAYGISANGSRIPYSSGLYEKIDSSNAGDLSFVMSVPSGTYALFVSGHWNDSSTSPSYCHCNADTLNSFKIRVSG